jgi:hypothetical protein
VIDVLLGQPPGLHDEHAAGHQVVRHPARGGAQLLERVEVADRRAEARDGVERAPEAERPHVVGMEHDARQPALGPLAHGGRELEALDVVEAGPERREVGAGPARDVQQRPCLRPQAPDPAHDVAGLSVPVLAAAAVHDLVHVGVVRAEHALGGRLARHSRTISLRTDA